MLKMVSCEAGSLGTAAVSISTPEMIKNDQNPYRPLTAIPAPATYSIDGSQCVLGPTQVCRERCYKEGCYVLFDHCKPIARCLGCEPKRKGSPADGRRPAVQYETLFDGDDEVPPPAPQLSQQMQRTPWKKDPRRPNKTLIVQGRHGTGRAEWAKK